MSWIAEYDTQGREFPTCVHVTKTTDTMTHGATYVPIEDGRAMRVENAKLRELVNDMWICIAHGSEGWDCTGCRRDPDNVCIMGISEFSYRMRELGIEVE